MAAEGGLLWIHTKGLAQVNGQYGFVDVPDGTVYDALIASGDAQHPSDGALALKYRDGECPNAAIAVPVVNQQPDPNAGQVQQPDPNAGQVQQPDPNAGQVQQPDPNAGTSGGTT